MFIVDIYPPVAILSSIRSWIVSSSRVFMLIDGSVTVVSGAGVVVSMAVPPIRVELRNNG
jgi:hypothetical protein